MVKQFFILSWQKVRNWNETGKNLTGNDKELLHFALKIEVLDFQSEIKKNT